MGKCDHSPTNSEGYFSQFRTVDNNAITFCSQNSLNEYGLWAVPCEKCHSPLKPKFCVEVMATKRFQRTVTSVWVKDADLDEKIKEREEKVRNLWEHKH